ncbi:hypothetical protein CYMTET_35458, partial [Cymbomonas tetramitiformis]
QGGGAIFSDQTLNCASCGFHGNRASFGENFAGPYSSLEPSQTVFNATSQEVMPAWTVRAMDIFGNTVLSFNGLVTLRCDSCVEAHMYIEGHSEPVEHGLAAFDATKVFGEPGSTLLLSADTVDGMGNTSISVHLQECGEDEKEGDDRNSCQNTGDKPLGFWIVGALGILAFLVLVAVIFSLWLLWRREFAWLIPFDQLKFSSSPHVIMFSPVSIVMKAKYRNNDVALTVMPGVDHCSELALLCYSSVHAEHLMQSATPEAWSESRNPPARLSRTKSDARHLASFKDRSDSSKESTSDKLHGVLEQFKRIPYLSGLLQALAMRQSVRQHLGSRFRFFTTRLNHPNIISVIGASSEPSGQ